MAATLAYIFILIINLPVLLSADRISTLVVVVDSLLYGGILGYFHSSLMARG